MSLPAWVDKARCACDLPLHERPSCPVKNLKEALAIAWEALLLFHNCDCEKGQRSHDVMCSLKISDDAMRRIEELGK